MNSRKEMIFSIAALAAALIIAAFPAKARAMNHKATGASTGGMLTGVSPTKGSGVYVAVERFTGTLAGLSGSFMLHHTGVMNRGSPFEYALDR